jgi:hypothetical protein
LLANFGTVGIQASAGNGRQVSVERLLEQPETRVSEEGTNLLEERKASRLGLDALVIL